MRVIVPLLAIVAAAAACGAEEPTGSAGSGQTLESWVSSVCAIENARPELTSPPPTSDSSGPPEWDPRRAFEQEREVLARLRAIPLPDEHRADVERFLELLASSLEGYEQELPRIEAASRRLDQAMSEVRPEDLPPVKDRTVAGEIMTQLMSVPAVREAWSEQMAALEDAMPPKEEQQELARLGGRLGLERCEAEREAKERLSAEELERCGALGDPVTLQELVDAFRANGVALSIDEDRCRNRRGVSDATNAGPSGHDLSDDRERAEGHVLCSVGDGGSDRKVRVVKYDDDYETYLEALNVDCSIYPFSPAVEKTQVAQVRRALEAVVRAED